LAKIVLKVDAEANVTKAKAALAKEKKTTKNPAKIKELQKQLKTAEVVLAAILKNG
jgi:hypothetical protein